MYKCWEKENNVVLKQNLPWCCGYEESSLNVIVVWNKKAIFAERIIINTDMKKSIFVIAVTALCAFTGCKQMDRSRVVTNPIDLDYEFTKGDGQGTSTSTDVDFNDPNLINSIPDEYKDIVSELI